MMASHHGEMEFGSPKVPMFAEAILLHQLDNLDSKMECARGLVERDQLVEGVWTGYSPALDRTLLKKNKFLDPAPAQAVEPKPAATAEPRKRAPEPAKASEPASPFAEKLVSALEESAS